MKERENINNKLNNLKAPINKKALWNDIQNDKDFPRKERKSKRLFWLFGCMAIVSIGFLWFGVNEISNSRYQMSDNLSEDSKNTLKTSDEGSLVQEKHLATESQHAMREQHSEKDSPSQKRKGKDPQVNSHNQNNNKKATSNINNQPEQKTSETRTTNNASQLQKNEAENIHQQQTTTSEIKNSSEVIKKQPLDLNPIITNNVPSTSPEAASTSPQLKNNNSTKHTTNTSNQVNKNTKVNSKTNNHIPIKPNSISSKNNQSTFSPQDQSIADGVKAQIRNNDIKELLAVSNQSQNLIKIPTIESLDLGLLGNEKDKFTLNVDSSVLKNDESTTLVSIEKRKLWNIEIAAGIGSGIHQKQLQIRQEQSEFDFQNQNTKSIESLLTSIRFKRKIKEHLTIGLGTQYYNSFQQMSFDTTSVEYFRQENFTSPYFLQETQNKAYTLFQKHHFIDIQLMIHRDFRIKKNQFNLGLGLGYNLKYSLTGKSVDQLENVFNINENEIFKTNLGHHYIFELGYQRSITDNLYLHSSIEVKSRLQLQQVKDNHSVVPYYFKAGIGYRF